MKKKLLTTMLAAMMTVSTFAAAVPVHAESTGRQDMYRLFNPYNGEHFYTASVAERDHLDAIGWNYEGVGWTAPTHSNTPVYRLFNKYVGDHHYTANKAERDYLISIGWNDEGIGWYSDDAKTVPIYRQFNPNAKTGSHNYTVNKQENDYLDSIGWNAEGIGWYGLGAASTHKWVPVTKTVHHDATYKTVHHDAVYKTVHHDAVTHQEKVIDVPYQEGYLWAEDGTIFHDYDSYDQYCNEHELSGGVVPDTPEQSHMETVVDQPAYDEQVLVTAAYDERVVDKAAYDETVTTGYKCSECGKTK